MLLKCRVIFTYSIWLFFFSLPNSCSKPLFKPSLFLLVLPLSEWLNSSFTEKLEINWHRLPQSPSYLYLNPFLFFLPVSDRVANLFPSSPSQQYLLHNAPSMIPSFYSSFSFLTQFKSLRQMTAKLFF